MRAIFLLFSVISTAGCTSVQPAPQAARDHKTPIALQKPLGSQRMIEQRKQQAEIAQGKLAVEGQLVR